MLLPAGMCVFVLFQDLASILCMDKAVLGFSSFGLSSINHCMDVLSFFRIEKYKCSVR